MFPLILLLIKEATIALLRQPADRAWSFPLILLLIKEATQHEPKRLCAWLHVFPLILLLIKEATHNHGHLHQGFATFPLILLLIKEATLPAELKPTEEQIVSINSTSYKRSNNIDDDTLALVGNDRFH